MTRREQIKSVYKLTGRNAGFYDGMMSCSTIPGKAICRMRILPAWIIRST